MTDGHLPLAKYDFLFYFFFPSRQRLTKEIRLYLLIPVTAEDRQTSVDLHMVVLVVVRISENETEAIQP